jgi:hypothetical protein
MYNHKKRQLLLAKHIGTKWTQNFCDKNLKKCIHALGKKKNTYTKKTLIIQNASINLALNNENHIL